MTKNRKDALGVSVLGMDERSSKLLAMFFKGPCEGFAKIVDDAHASVDIIDTHFAHSEQLIEKSLARVPLRSIIVLTSKTTERINKDNLLYLDKPIRADEMMDAIDWANDINNGRYRRKPFFDRVKASASPHAPTVPAKPTLKVVSEQITEQPKTPVTLKPIVDNKAIDREQKKLIDLDEQRKKAKYLSAISIDEKDFDAYIGVFTKININNVNDRRLASYHAKNYYQGFVQSAYKLSLEKTQTLQLNSHWEPLVIMPHSREIWVDADDSVLKEMAVAKIDIAKMRITGIDKEILQKTNNLEKIQDMNAFLWKLALWTSKGRYPRALDVDSPVYLKQWPDFTRYVVTPHALRITSLLVGRNPDTMVNVAALLNIELRYVFVFISAAHALGLTGQATRQMDALIKTTLPETPPAKKGLFSRIINKLRGS